MWILIPLICVVLAIVAAYVLFRGRATLYVFRSNGFSAYSTGESPAHRTDEAGLLRVVRRLMPGDLFDMLWVSKQNDEYTGLILTVKAGTPVLTVTFKTAAEQAKLKSFAKSMAALGYAGSENSDGFNGGFGERFRVTIVSYALPKVPEEVTGRSQRCSCKPRSRRWKRILSPRLEPWPDCWIRSRGQVRSEHGPAE